MPRNIAASSKFSTSFEAYTTLFTFSTSYLSPSTIFRSKAVSFRFCSVLHIFVICLIVILNCCHPLVFLSVGKCKVKAKSIGKQHLVLTLTNCILTIYVGNIQSKWQYEMCRFAIPKVQALKRQNTIIQYHHFALHTGFCEWQKIANFAANANVGMYKHISVAFNG